MMANLQDTQATAEFREKLSQVAALCQTDTDGPDTTLADWMVEGYWQTMSARDIATEWDSLSE